jgi:hypothetical protein
VHLLFRPGTSEQLALTFGTLIIAGSHAESIGNQVGEAEDDGHLHRQSGAGCSCNHRKGGHATVDRTQYSITQVAVLLGRRQAQLDRGRLMLGM